MVAARSPSILKVRAEKDAARPSPAGLSGSCWSQSFSSPSSCSVASRTPVLPVWPQTKGNVSSPARDVGLPGP